MITTLLPSNTTITKLHQYQDRDPNEVLEPHPFIFSYMIGQFYTEGHVHTRGQFSTALGGAYIHEGRAGQNIIPLIAKSKGILIFG